MAVPQVSRLSHVKVPVTDLAVAVAWYSRVLSFQPIDEYPDAEGVVRGVHGELPGVGDVLALREDPDAARGLGVFAVANFRVADRAALQECAAHLDELGVAHGAIGDTPHLSYLVFANPDGQEIHLYTPAHE